MSFGQESFAELKVKDAWVRSAPPNSQIFSGYLDFKNITSDKIIIKKIQSNAFEKIEIHSSSIEDGISSMRKADTLEIRAQSEAKLQPGGYHLMLMNPRKAIKENNPIELMIYYEAEERTKILRLDAIVLRNGYE